MGTRYGHSTVVLISQVSPTHQQQPSQHVVDGCRPTRGSFVPLLPALMRPDRTHRADVGDGVAGRAGPWVQRLTRWQRLPKRLRVCAHQPAPFPPPYGCSTVVRTCFTCPVMTVVTHFIAVLTSSPKLQRRLQRRRPPTTLLTPRRPTDITFPHVSVYTSPARQSRC